MHLLIVLPAFNEENLIAKSVDSVVDFCRREISPRLMTWQVIVVDNNSTDKTSEIGRELAERYSEVEYIYLKQKGKGIAIKTGWNKFDADVYCFMDADLATDLEALPRMLDGFKSGADVVIGSRFHSESKVDRSFVRLIVSRTYRFILRSALKSKVDDAPCGFKAITAKVKDDILKLVKNNEWFFDSELIVMAEKKGYNIVAVPVSWSDPREGEDKSRVQVVSLSVAYLRKLFELKKRL